MVHRILTITSLVPSKLTECGTCFLACSQNPETGTLAQLAGRHTAADMRPQRHSGTTARGVVAWGHGDVAVQRHKKSTCATGTRGMGTYKRQRGGQRAGRFVRRPQLCPEHSQPALEILKSLARRDTSKAGLPGRRMRTARALLAGLLAAAACTLLAMSGSGLQATILATAAELREITWAGKLPAVHHLTPMWCHLCEC